MIVTRLFRSIAMIALSLVGVIGQTGNGINIERSSFSPGGISSEGPFVLTSSIGQSVTGSMNAPGLSLSGGFIVPDLVPTAAAVTISGRALDPSGLRGAAGATVTLTDSFGVVHHSLSSTFGYFKLEGVESGKAYILMVSHKQFVYQPQVLVVGDTIDGLIIVAEPRR